MPNFWVEDKFDGLTLYAEEEAKLGFSEELQGLVKEIRWLGIFKVATTKPLSHITLFKQMRNAWASAKDVTFKVLDSNLLLVQFQCLVDWNRVVNGGPWLFRNASVVLE